MKRKGLGLLLALVLALTGAGCWDRSELEEEAFVLAIGVDKGQQARYSVTLAIALPAKMAGGGKGGGGGGGKDEKPYMLTTVEAPTVTGAIGMANSYLDRQVSIRHTKAFFLGEDLARISGMHTMDEFARFRQGRRSVFYIVTKGKAADFLDGLKPELEKDPQKFIEQLTYNYRQTGTIPASSQIQSFITAVNTGYAAPVTYYVALKEEEGDQKSASGASLSESGYKAGELPRKGGPNMEMLGGAAFKGEKMVGVLSGEDMRMVLMLQDRFQRGFFSIEDPNEKGLFVSLEVHQGRPLKLNVDVSGPTPKITGVVTLEGEVLAIQSDRDYTDPTLQAQLEDATSGAVSDRIRTLIAKTQKWETDVAGFGEAVVKHFPTVEAWDRFDWPSRYRDASINITVRMTLRRFGKQLTPPKARG